MKDISIEYSVDNFGARVNIVGYSRDTLLGIPIGYKKYVLWYTYSTVGKEMVETQLKQIKEHYGQE